MAHIIVSKLVGRNGKVADKAEFNVEEKASQVCKILGLKAPEKKMASINEVSGVEAVAELAIKILGLSRSWPIFYKMTDYFGHYEVAIAD